jgi:ribosome biogenesis protein MAK21
MKPIVIREVAAVVLRPPVEGKLTHGRYYGIITLNQVLLAREEQEVAGKLIDVYFKVFGDLLAKEAAQHSAAVATKSKKGRAPLETQHDVEVDSKLLAAVLTGVNRAFPYAALDEASLRDRLDVLYRITHHGAFNVSLQALSLVFRLTTASAATGTPPDRFYRTLYDSLIDPRLPHASKHAMYLNLVFKACRADPSHNRQAAFLKRLLQSLALYHLPPYICGALRLVGELLAANPALKGMLSDPEDAAADEHFADAPASDDEREEAGDDVEARAPGSGRYDPRKREPQYAGAEKTCLWELVRCPACYCDSSH